MYFGGCDFTFGGTSVDVSGGAKRRRGAQKNVSSMTANTLGSEWALEQYNKILAASPKRMAAKKVVTKPSKAAKKSPVAKPAKAAKKSPVAKPAKAAKSVKVAKKSPVAKPVKAAKKSPVAKPVKVTKKSPVAKPVKVTKKSPVAKPTKAAKKSPVAKTVKTVKTVKKSPAKTKKLSGFAAYLKKVAGQDGTKRMASRAKEYNALSPRSKAKL